jgi:putative spermidine/putrescine transport system permease protein
LLLPASAITLIAFLLPMGWLARLSLDLNDGGILVAAVTADNYRHFFTDAFYLGVLWRSVWVASSVAALAVLAAYPIALFLFRTRSRWRGLLAVLTIAPLLVSSVVRTFGWMIILGDQGWINSTLLALGLIAAPVQLMNNTTGVLIGLTEIMMPTTTLALLAASPWRCFRRVTLPLTAPGIAVGVLVTFVLSISSFITPSLLGGGRVPMLASTIYEEALETLNWPMAAAISLILIAVFGAVLVGYERLARRWA